MLLLPYRVDVPFNHKPIINWLLIISVVVVFFFEIVSPDEVIGKYVMDGWNLKRLVGHMWLHAGFWHIFGNMLFLWLFGNAVCSKVGNILYFPFYLFLGIIAAASHNIFNGGPAIGASGAINGIVGMYLVFFPENSVSMFFCLPFPFFLYFRPVCFSISGYWIILLWFVFDLFGAWTGTDNVAYFAHIGGFLGGVGLASLLLKYKIVVMEKDERSIYELLKRKKKAAFASEGPNYRWQEEYVKPEINAPKIDTPAFLTPPEQINILRFYCDCGQKIKVPKIYAGRKGVRFS